MATYFAKSQLELVTSVLDRIIPPDAKMPGAGEVAIDYLDRAVGSSVDMKRQFGRGLSAIQVEAQSRYSKEFAKLSDDQKDNVLREIEGGEPEFFDRLVQQTYNGYYANSRVLELLGLEARPPQPRGHQVEQGNFDLIESVKRRGMKFREV